MSEISFPLGASLGNVLVQTTSHRGFTPEEVADMAVERILGVTATAPEPIAEQARVYKDRIRAVLAYYMNEVVRSHNVTLVSKFKAAGHPELIPILDA